MKQELVWNLSNLFESNEKFCNEIDKIYEDLEATIRFKDSKFDDNILVQVLDLKWQIKEKANRVLIYGSLNYYKDIENQVAKEMKDISEKLVAKIDATLGFIDEKIIELGESTVDEYLLLNKNLKIYELYFKNIFRLRSHIQDEETNFKIEQLKNEINSTLNQYNQLNRDIDLGTIIIDNEEIKLTPSNIAKYLLSRDREVRKQTYLSVNNAYKNHNLGFARLLNEIYYKRVQISKLECYSSVNEKALFDENIDPIILERLINSVYNNLGMMKKYLNLKSESLSISDPHLYDYSVPFDNGNKKRYPLENAIDIVKKALEPLGEEYLRVVDILLSNGHIDALLDEKKHQSITFSWSTYSFMNYREAYSDLKNLIHEIGHLVNAYLSKEKQKFIYEDSTVFVGEVASLVNEILLNKYLYQNALSEEEKIFYLSTNIENYCNQIFRQTMYTEFENKLYQYAMDNVELSSQLLEDEYIAILKKYYGEATIYDDCTNAEWSRLGHLYRHSYYVYKYATGLIMANYIVNSIINEKTISVDKYLDFLSSGSNDYSLKLLQKLGIDLTDETTINNSFRMLEDDINEMSSVLIKKFNMMICWNK